MEPQMQLDAQAAVAERQQSTGLQTDQWPRSGGEPRWGLAKKVGFRFVFAYLILFILTAQEIASIPGIDFVVEKYHGLWHRIVPWIGKHVLRLSYDMPMGPSGSGDKTYDWVLALCYLVLAVVVSVVWSVLDRKRTSYSRLHHWLRLAVRFSLGVAMIMYGTAKAIPLQMPAPSLGRLLEPYGDSSPMGILWTFIGASAPFEIFTGCAELLGGILLLLPRTTLLGALICIADSTMVFVLNMSYDVPVKLYSFHLLLMGVFLIVPDLGRLGKMFILNRPVAPAQSPRFFNGKWLNRVPQAALTALGLFLLGLNFYGAFGAVKQYGWGAPRSPLYGIWDVAELNIDGRDRPPLVTDQSRWRRIIFQSPERLTIQPMAGTNLYYVIDLNTEAGTMDLTKSSDPDWKAGLTYSRVDPEHMTVDGTIDGQRTHAALVRFDDSKFLLRNRGFHWVQELPFNR